MSTAFTTLKDLVLTGIGRTASDDADAIKVAEAAINYMTVVAALVFKPPELERNANLTANQANSTVPLTSLTKYLNVVRIYNQTDSKRMGAVPFELWDLLPATTETKFFSLFGNVLHVKGTPLANKVLNVYYLGYPNKLVNAGDTLDFDNHDAFIVSGAIALAFAFFEEGEAAGIWQKALETLLAPYSLGRTEREIIQGQTQVFEAAVKKET